MSTASRKRKPHASPEQVALTKAQVAQSVENLQANFECMICLSFAKKPRYLPCNHGFCTECLTKWGTERKSHTKSDVYPCPVCKHEFNKRQAMEDPLMVDLAKLAQKLHKLTHEDLGLQFMLSQGM